MGGKSKQNQPPLGGCVLKQVKKEQQRRKDQDQPPLGGCVLKLLYLCRYLLLMTSRL